MKLVTRFNTAFEAEEASDLLEQNGIATFVSNKNSVHLPMIRGGASHAALWVIVESQLHDALCLLEDNDHKVEHKLSNSEMIEIKSALANPDTSIALGFLVKVLGIVTVLAIVVYYLTNT